jgi:hypothetical protein
MPSSGGRDRNAADAGSAASRSGPSALAASSCTPPASATLLWLGACLVIAALAVTAERAAGFLGVDAQLWAFRAWMVGPSLSALRPREG